jgi:leucyl-tRNA synthetase
MVDGEKMSKSKGNFLLAREVIKEYGADATRLAVLNGGEGVDDANFERAFARSVQGRLRGILDIVSKHYGKGRSEVTDVDKWLESKMNSLISEITPLMEETLFRTALQKVFFEYQNMINKYLSRVDEVHKDIFSTALKNWVVMISPYAPFTAEEAWSIMGCEGYVSLANWPQADLSKIDPTAEGIVEFVDDALGHIENLRTRLGKETLDTVSLGIAQPWKYIFAKEMMLKLKETFNVRELIEHFETVKGLEDHQEDVRKLIPAIVKKPSRLPKVFLSREDELAAASKVKMELEKRYDCAVTIEEEGELADKAFPGSLAVRL